MDAVAFAAGVVTSLIASWLFWNYQLRVVPKVRLCDDISVMPAEGNKWVLRFKVINLGRNQVVDVALNAWLTELVERGGVKVSRSIKKFDVAKSETLTLSGIDNEDRPWGLSSELTISFNVDVHPSELLVNSEKRIVAALKVADAKSRSVRVIQKAYSGGNLKAGEFKAYQSHVVLPIPHGTR